MTSTTAVPTLNDLERLYLSTKFCFGMGPGKSTAPLSAMHSPLLPAAICPNDYVSSVGVTLACYQQAGSGRKYVGISGKWRC
jgi:hypothetical protein